MTFIVRGNSLNLWMNSRIWRREEWVNVFD